MIAKRFITRLVFTTVIVLSLFFSSLGTTPVYAAGIVVNTDADEVTTNGLCSLREAITNANDDVATYPDCAAGFEADTITFAGNYIITLDGSQLPVIASALTINGNGAENTIIQANANPGAATYRVFEAGSSLTLDSLTVRHGNCGGVCESITNSGGGILSHVGALTIKNAMVTNNSAGQGGGIYSSGSVHLVVTNSTISENASYNKGGGIFFYSAGLFSISDTTISENSAMDGGGVFIHLGTLIITDSTISLNRATNDGGGVFNYGGNLTMTDSTVSLNYSTNNGGGIYAEDPIVITNTTISENSADNNGGGIFHANFDEYSDENVSNSTISGNYANNEGGGIYNWGKLAVRNTTISANSAWEGGGIFNYVEIVSLSDVQIEGSTLHNNLAAWGGALYNGGNMRMANTTVSSNEASYFGGGIYSGGFTSIHNSTIAFNRLEDAGAGGIDGNVYLYNSIVAGNTSAFASQYRDCSGSIFLVGVNLFWNTTNCSWDPASPGSYSSLYSLNELGPLQDNGGPTWTHALIPIAEGSRAIDAGNNILCANLPVNNLDQRGVARPQDGDGDGISACDVGAYEYEYEPDTTSPSLLSVVRADSSPSDASSVNFTVTFSESVTGVDSGDFVLSTMGVSGASIATVNGSGGTYTVTVNTGTGDGTIRLDVVDNDSIVDAAGNPLGGVGAGNGNFSGGEVYEIQKNEAPTDIQLSASTITEGLPAGTTVGTLTTIDPDSGDAHTYSFCGGVDDTSFALAGNALNTATIFDYELQSSFNICIRSTDAGGLFMDKAFQILVEVVPPPQAAFVFTPEQPSTLDTIQFSDRTAFYQFDPAASFAWNFGDGTTSSDRNPTHRYAADGDYTVQHTITTRSGGTSSVSQIVQVRTHDVAITKVSAPSSANLGQTRPITIYIKNNRYAETVLLELYKSNPNVAGGFELVGSYTQFVPVRSGNRTSSFVFNYTFTAADLAVGKVTFKAVATLVNGHDAILSDNELTSSPPTLVRR